MTMKPDTDGGREHVWTVDIGNPIRIISSNWNQTSVKVKSQTNLKTKQK